VQLRYLHGSLSPRRLDDGEPEQLIPGELIDLPRRPAPLLGEPVIDEHVSGQALRQGERRPVARPGMPVDQVRCGLGLGCFGSGWSESSLTRSSSGFIPTRNLLKSAPERSDSPPSICAGDCGRGTWNDHPVTTRWARAISWSSSSPWKDISAG